MYLSNNYLFSTNTPAPRINAKNFAINGRIYDTTADKALYSHAIVNTGLGVHDLTKMNTINFTNVNPDTAMGQSWFH